jgi:SAM-dependent methyltransferase
MHAIDHSWSVYRRHLGIPAAHAQQQQHRAVTGLVAAGELLSWWTMPSLKRMSAALTQHQVEIQRNLRAWDSKPLLRTIYSNFYDRIVSLMDRSLPGKLIEIGSGIGNLKTRVPQAIATDLFPNPWLDLVCDGYELPFQAETISHLILFDVFHHLRAPWAFLREARRVLKPQGRMILFEPYISASSYPVYGLLHHEPVALRQAISTVDHLSRPRDYYAAQGNATRLFFGRGTAALPEGWTIFHREALASFSYLFSGGFSKPSMYPFPLLGVAEKVDQWLSRWPRLFGARCLVGLTRQ